MKNELLLLGPENFKHSVGHMEVEGVFNPGAIRLKNKDILLYVRVAEKPKLDKGCGAPMIVSKDKYRFDRKKGYEIVGRSRNLIYLRDGICRLTNISHFRKVILDSSGFKIKKIIQKPAFTGIPDFENLGVEDPRLVKIGNKYFMTYVSISTITGVSTSLAVSKDLIHWERKGIIFREQNKDVVIFPEKINNKYIALNRPEGFFRFSKPNIWISYSKDLIYWGEDKSLISPRKNSWDSERVGAGTPPIKTEEGWLFLYHGIKKRRGQNIYSAGGVLLDLKNPEKIIARTPKTNPFISPEKDYEKEGFINNVVFPTGMVPCLNKKDVLIFSGGADKFTSVKKFSIKKILNSMTHY